MFVSLSSAILGHFNTWKKNASIVACVVCQQNRAHSTYCQHRYLQTFPVPPCPLAPACPSGSWNTLVLAVLKEDLKQEFMFCFVLFLDQLFSVSWSCSSAWEPAFEIPGEKHPKEQLLKRKTCNCLELGGWMCPCPERVRGLEHQLHSSDLMHRGSLCSGYLPRHAIKIKIASNTSCRVP